MMGEKYAECHKSQKHLDGKSDGCQEFSSIGGGLRCATCLCHRNYHRRVVRYATEVVYTECHKTHHRDGGAGYKDGCKEFVGSGMTKTCAACGCHKSFHRNDLIKDLSSTTQHTFPRHI